MVIRAVGLPLHTPSAQNNGIADCNTDISPCVLCVCAQVTARGFAPLLQFAYTAKLLLSRDNIQEVIRCADFLRMHNLEDSCFRFLEAQLRSEDDVPLLCQKVESESNQSEDEGMQAETPVVTAAWDASPRTCHRPDILDGRVEPGRQGASDLPRCPKYRKYQRACSKHNDSNDNESSSHTSSTSGFPSTLLGGPDVNQIKQEPRVEDEPILSGNEVDGRDKDESMADMELDGGKSPTCLRVLFNRGFPDPPDASRPSKASTQGEHKKDHRPAFPKDAKDGFSTGLSLRSASCDGVCKQDAELDRRSVIFAPAHSYPGGGNSPPDKELPPEQLPKGLWVGGSQSLPSSQAAYSTSSGVAQAESPSALLLCRQRPNASCPVPIKVCPRSPPSETRTRTSSSCSSYSYAEDGSGGSPCSLPQFEFSSSPCSSVSRCLPADPQESGTGVDAPLFSAARPKIKCERAYGTNSSDESGSFSEGDSESCHVQEQGSEVSDLECFLSLVFFIWYFCIKNYLTHALPTNAFFWLLLKCFFANASAFLIVYDINFVYI